MPGCIFVIIFAYKILHVLYYKKLKTVIFYCGIFYFLFIFIHLFSYLITFPQILLNFPLLSLSVALLQHSMPPSTRNAFNLIVWCRGHRYGSQLLGLCLRTQLTIFVPTPTKHTAIFTQHHGVPRPTSYLLSNLFVHFFIFNQTWNPARLRGVVTYLAIFIPTPNVNIATVCLNKVQFSSKSIATG
eukprot:TRINITY_DN23870_c0_g1_i2.p2 TRINITY_DN23870_c0_g1~~TRINITY_DN23870_c0_g1_i2.p2  ORF type:complete len:203 (+),score=-3.97 TRINITY_DN23870_c0_g1_i2:52-609(+)